MFFFFFSSQALTYLISTTLVTSDHVSVVFAGGFMHTARTTKTAVVRHRTTFGGRMDFF